MEGFSEPNPAAPLEIVFLPPHSACNHQNSEISPFPTACEIGREEQKSVHVATPIGIHCQKLPAHVDEDALHGQGLASNAIRAYGVKGVR